MNTAVLIPVYNEAQNIELLIKQIIAVNEKYAIVIIDDNSQDGTSEIIQNLKNEFNIRHYVRKNQKGYGSALTYGFAQTGGFDIIITMDGDLSHDPSGIPCLIRAIINGYDVVIGSRYTDGGNIRNWPLSRRITSKLTNLFVSKALRTNIKDNTSGYRAYSTTAIKILSDKVKSKGYSALEEILYWAKQQNLKCKEIPIIFTDRKQGVSKARMIKEAYKLLLFVLTLRIRREEK